MNTKWLVDFWVESCSEALEFWFHPDTRPEDMNTSEAAYVLLQSFSEYMYHAKSREIFPKMKQFPRRVRSRLINLALRRIGTFNPSWGAECIENAWERIDEVTRTIEEARRLGEDCSIAKALNIATSKLAELKKRFRYKGE
jgi:hypothetical protein